jgi:hypothetical protein
MAPMRRAVRWWASGAAVLLTSGLGLGAALGRSAPAPPERTIVGTSLDWRPVADGEQLIVVRGGQVIAAIGREHAPFTFGSQIGFLARPVRCVPAAAHSCFVLGQILGLYTFQPAVTELTIRAVLVSESADSVTVAAMATPAGQPKLLFTFPASARTLVSAQVHAGGLVLLRLVRVKGGAQGPESAWSLYSWISTSIRAVPAGG